MPDALGLWSPAPDVYQGVGHLLTRNLANQINQFDPDPEFPADGIANQLRFLRRLGLVGAPWPVSAGTAAVRLWGHTVPRTNDPALL